MKLNDWMKTLIDLNCEQRDTLDSVCISVWRCRHAASSVRASWELKQLDGRGGKWKAVSSTANASVSSDLLAL